MFLSGSELIGFGVGRGPRTLGSLITGGTNIGNMTLAGGLAECFDGNTSNAGGYTTTDPAYVGKTIAKRVFSAIWWGASAQGVIQDANPSTTITLYGKTGVAPSTATNGTAIGSTTFTDDTLNTQHPITSTDNETLWDHVWCTVTAVGGAERRCAELQMYESV
jgi:hypothetical protein